MIKQVSALMVSFLTIVSFFPNHASCLESQSYSQANVHAILTDIEGTTTSISFVHDVLFPYAKENVSDFLFTHQNDPTIEPIIEQVKEIQAAPQADLNEVVQILISWMQQDKKITPLKTLQGLMWEAGYQSKAFTGHLYEDAYLQMKNWKEHGMPLYVYSSGSVYAQKLLFSHSDFGDITPLFSGFFDTKVGGKKEAPSYHNIANQLGLDPKNVLFLSDIVDELNAARDAGMQTLLLCRDGLPSSDCGHPYVTDFNQIEIQPLTR